MTELVFYEKEILLNGYDRVIIIEYMVYSIATAIPLQCLYVRVAIQIE